MAALAGSLVIHELTKLVRTHPDPRFAYNYALGLSMPIPFVRYVDNGWLLFFAILLTFGTVYWLAMRASRTIASRGMSPKSFAFTVIAVYLALATCTITISGDNYAYVLWGRLYGLFGTNPYILNVPLRGSDTQVAQLLLLYSNPPPSDNYGPLWTLVAGAIGRLEASTTIAVQFLTHRLLAIASVFAAGAALWLILKHSLINDRIARVALFSFNPLVMYECAVEGHNDMMMVALALWSYAIVDELPLLAGILLGTAVAVKFLALIIAPFLAIRSVRRHGWLTTSAGVLAALLVVVLYFTPFWKGWQTFVSLWRQGSAIGSSPMWMARIVWRLFSDRSVDTALLSVSVVVLAGILIWATIRYASTLRSDEIFKAVTAALWCAPGPNPQYLLWLSPAMASRGVWSTYAWSLAVTGFGFYALYINRPSDSDAVVIREVAALTIAITLIPLAIVILKRRRAKATRHLLQPRS